MADVQLEDIQRQLSDQPPRAQKRTLPRGTEYTDVAICIGLEPVSGGDRKEIIHQIDGSQVRITSVEHKVNEKMRAVKEDGQLIGYEPTGEYELTLKVKYFKE